MIVGFVFDDGLEVVEVEKASDGDGGARAGEIRDETKGSVPQFGNCSVELGEDVGAR
jgi:hypothetical protein